MIVQSAFPAEPWCVRETQLRLDLLAQSEPVFVLPNGHIGLRGNLDEGEPHGIPGTYLNSFYELRPLPRTGDRVWVPRVGMRGAGPFHPNSAPEDSTRIATFE